MIIVFAQQATMITIDMSGMRHRLLSEGARRGQRPATRRPGNEVRLPY
jgi:hypothetical protein